MKEELSGGRRSAIAPLLSANFHPHSGVPKECISWNEHTYNQAWWNLVARTENVSPQLGTSPLLCCYKRLTEEGCDPPLAHRYSSICLGCLSEWYLLLSPFLGIPGLRGSCSVTGGQKQTSYGVVVLGARVRETVFCSWENVPGWDFLQCSVQLPAHLSLDAVRRTAFVNKVKAPMNFNNK